MDYVTNAIVCICLHHSTSLAAELTKKAGPHFGGPESYGTNDYECDSSHRSASLATEQQKQFHISVDLRGRQLSVQCGVWNVLEYIGMH